MCRCWSSASRRRRGGIAARRLVVADHGGAQAGRRRGRLYRRCFRLGKRLFELDAVAERARHRVTRYRHRAKCVRETKSGHGHNGGIADTSPAGGRRLFASTAGPCPCSSMCGRRARARQATALRSCQPIERGAHRGEDLGGHVIAQAVTHNIALSTTADGVCVTQDAQMLACRGPAALDDSSDITSRKLRGLQGANDLEACRVAQTHQYTLGSARRSRFQHARLRARYGAVVTYASGLHAFACRRVRLDVLSRPRGSNPEPVVYKTTALPIELGRRGFPNDSRTRRARERLESGGCENYRFDLVGRTARVPE